MDGKGTARECEVDECKLSVALVRNRTDVVRGAVNFETVGSMTDASCNALPHGFGVVASWFCRRVRERGGNAGDAGAGEENFLSSAVFTQAKKLVMIRELFGYCRTLIADLFRPWGASVNQGGMKACNP